jgi:hypothetical protein
MIDPQHITEREENFQKFGSDTVGGIICFKCGKTLPRIFAIDHLDPNFSVNKCPHKPIYEIKEIA